MKAESLDRSGTKSQTQSVWDMWKKNLLKYDGRFMIERNQSEHQQERKPLF